MFSFPALSLSFSGKVAVKGLSNDSYLNISLAIQRSVFCIPWNFCCFVFWQKNLPGLLGINTDNCTQPQQSILYIKPHNTGFKGSDRWGWDFSTPKSWRLGNLPFRLEATPDPSVPHRHPGRTPATRGQCCDYQSCRVTSSLGIPPRCTQSERNISLYFINLWPSIDIIGHISIKFLGGRCRSVLKAVENLTFSSNSCSSCVQNTKISTCLS